MAIWLSASAPQSVTICLEDEIDISRGDMIVPALAAPHVARRFRSSIVWMNAKPLEPGRSYFIKHTSHQVRGVIRGIHHRLDVNTLEHVEAQRLELNEIGEISVETHRPLFFDPVHARTASTGAFIVIDPLSNETLGAGMIIDIEGKEETRGQVTGGRAGDALRASPRGDCGRRFRSRAAAGTRTVRSGGFCNGDIDRRRRRIRTDEGGRTDRHRSWRAADRLY